MLLGSVVTLSGAIIAAVLTGTWVEGRYQHITREKLETRLTFGALLVWF